MESSLEILPRVRFKNRLWRFSSAGSHTDTLLRLNPLCLALVLIIRSSLRPFSAGVTGGVCKEQWHILRDMLNHVYYEIQLHGAELQASIRTMNRFKDWLHLTMSQLVVLSFVARV